MKIREMTLFGSQFPVGRGREGRKSDLFLLLLGVFVGFIFKDGLESVLLNFLRNASQMGISHMLINIRRL